MFASRSSATGKAPVPPPQSIEAIRRRARHRLIGAAVLVLLGVIGFPLLFDTEPRPILVDIPIEIPSKNPKPAMPATPVVTPAVKEAAKSAPAPAKPAEASVAANESLGEREEVVASESPRPTQKPVDKLTDKAPTPAIEKPPQKPETAALQAPVKATPASADAERARALLQGKPDPDKPLAAKPPAGTERLVVQVGAFAEAAGAREVRSKLERAGLKTYTHVAQTPQGERTRVRVGPFDNRADAEKAAARVKALGLPAAVLTL